MKIFKDRKYLNKEIYKTSNLGFVPTMGGLHNGHKYLIKKAKKRSQKVVVSIFINPKQFNSKKDFKNYPRNLKKDLNILKKLKVDYVYLPNNKDIFSFKTKKKIFEDRFSKKLCGKFRKTHFKGVLIVVNRLLEIINPKYLFLGNKDFQQLYLILMHIKKRKIDTKIVSCKTVREKNGIACSSRNFSLTKREKKIASNIYTYLKKKKKLIKINKQLKKQLISISNQVKRLGVSKLEYLELLNLKNLKKPLSSKNKFNIFLAYYVGNVRLIDNF